MKQFTNFSKSSVQYKLEPSSSLLRKQSLQEQFEREFQRGLQKRSNFTHFPREEDFKGACHKPISGSQFMATESKDVVYKPKQMQQFSKYTKRPYTHLPNFLLSKGDNDSPLKNVNSH